MIMAFSWLPLAIKQKKGSDGQALGGLVVVFVGESTNVRLKVR